MSHLDTDELRIHFIEHGRPRGRAVLLIHGWPDDASTWNAVLNRMQNENMRFVVPTLRGFGERRSAAIERPAQAIRAFSPWMRSR